MNKKIMEIIQPYTDKTTFGGCYWQFEDEKPTIMSDTISEQDIHDSLEGTDTKILGHYDITAVLKFVFMKGVCNHKLYAPTFDNASISCEWRNGGIYNMPQFIIPNRPLHLYTKSEEKNLLDLLKRLNK